jgi:hypothetical protein
MSVSRSPVPRPALVYALAGLLPFIASTALVFLGGAETEVAVVVEALYGAVILSFLGGARWGIEIQRMTPRAGVITLTMAPSVLGFGAALWTMGGNQGSHAVSGLGALAVLFIATGAWDVTSPDVPDWYPRLRIALTLAVVSLLGLSILGGLRG